MLKMWILLLLLLLYCDQLNIHFVYFKSLLALCRRFSWLLPITLVLRCFRITLISLSSHSTLALFHSFWNSGSSLSKTCGCILIFNLAVIGHLETDLLRASRCLCLQSRWSVWVRKSLCRASSSNWMSCWSSSRLSSVGSLVVGPGPMYCVRMDILALSSSNSSLLPPLLSEVGNSLLQTSLSWPYCSTS